MYYTHINRGTIDANRKHGRNDPPIKTQFGKRGKAEYGHAAVFPSGCTIVYDNEGKILPCGARLVIVSNEKPYMENYNEV
jgi:hypothetical protein